MRLKFPYYSEHSKHWDLDEEMVFLNHGSFGSTPGYIMQKQSELRTQMEKESVRFMVRELYPLYQSSLARLAQFIGANENNLVFVKNATMGVNTVFHSLKFEPGDEILIHSHAYGACVNTIKWYADRHKAKVVIANIPFPVSSKQQILDAYHSCLSSRTKIALIDHITSPTGILFPVAELVNSLQEKNIDVLVDGAHAPGQVPLNLNKLNAAYYTGNCHKWICSPKGSAFLHVRKDRQHLIHPLQISHHFDVPVSKEKLWQGQFFWPGTDDYTAYCCVGAAIDYFENNFEGGWKYMMQQNNQLALQGRKLLCEKLDTGLPAPDDMIVNLASVCLGDGELPPYGFNFISAVQEKLFSEYKIEVPVLVFNKEKPRMWVRIAAQLYNSLEQMEYLAECLLKIRK